MPEQASLDCLSSGSAAHMHRQPLSPDQDTEADLVQFVDQISHCRKNDEVV